MKKLMVFLLVVAIQTVSCNIGGKQEYSIVGTWIITKYQEGEAPIITGIRFEGDESQGSAYYSETEYWYTVDGMDVHWSYFTHACLSSYNGQFVNPTVMEGTWFVRCLVAGIYREGTWRAIKVSLLL